MSIRRALHALAQLVKDSPGPNGLVIQPYRGYSSLEKIFLMGRVFKESVFATREGTLNRDLTNIGQRLFRRGVANVVLVARFGETEQQAVTDEGGYFRVHLHPLQPPLIETVALPWRTALLNTISPLRRVLAEILRERERQQEASSLKLVYEMKQPALEDIQKSPEYGRLAETPEQESEGGLSPNIVV